jgi:hypothetical protein
MPEDESSASPAAPSLFIATPIHHAPEVQWTASMFRVIHELPQHGVRFSILTPCGDSLITRARNNCVKKFLASKSTHLLFIDSDLEFRVEDIVAMLKSGHGLVGGLYPKKHINWKAVRAAAEAGAEDLSAFAADYVVNLSPGEHNCIGGCVAVDELGTGFMLIARDVLERYIAAYPEIQYLSDSDEDRDEPVHAVFDCYIDPASKRYLSEDYAFCRRAMALGIQPMAYLPAKLAHVGRHVFKGDLGALFQGLNELVAA